MNKAIINEQKKLLKEIIKIQRKIEKIYSFGDYKEKLKEVNLLCSELQEVVWTDGWLYPYCIQAEAFLVMGEIYEEKKLYDLAIQYFQSCTDLIEKRCLKQAAVRIYMRACISLAQCYKEKHSSLDIIKKYQQAARNCLELAGISQKRLGTDEIERYEYCSDELQDDRVNELFWTFYHRCSDEKIDTYGQRQTVARDEMDELIEDLREMGKLNVGLSKDGQTVDTKKQCTYGTLIGLCIGKFFLKQEIASIQTQQVEEEQKKALKACWYDYLKRNGEEPRSLPEIPGIPSLSLVLSIWRYVLEKDGNNTIAMGNIALCFLYMDIYYQKRKETGTFLEACREWAERIACSMKIQPSDKGNDFASIYGEPVLQQILEREADNIFALNLKAILKAGQKYDSTEEYYPALRQAALKKRFFRIKELYKKWPEGRDWELLKNLLTDLTILYREIIWFMDLAAINLEDEDWKDLVVCHYTRLPVLSKLINKSDTSKMRLQNVHHLNDPKEGIPFLDALKIGLKRASGVQGGLMQEVLKNYEPEKNGGVRNSVYMGSYSGRLDQLNMWVQYGDSGKGCNLRIQANETFDSRFKIALAENSVRGYVDTIETTHSYQFADNKYPLYMVTYLPDYIASTEDITLLQKYAAERARIEKDYYEAKCNKSEAGKGDEKLSYFREEARWWTKQQEILEALPGFLERISHRLKVIDSGYAGMAEQAMSAYDSDQMPPYVRDMEDEIINTIMVMLDLVRFLFKSDDYKDEREYRVLQYSSRPQYDDSEKEIPKLYIEMEKKVAYQGICFGPLVQNCDSLAAYALNIKREDADGHPLLENGNYKLEISKSRIHYR